METWFGNSFLAAGVTAAIAGLPAEFSGTCIGLAMVAYLLRPGTTAQRGAPKDALRGSRA
ncbi:MAG: hypothetical protein HY778_05265 [Betaproteobacteria bacterium]|nr:hypothetical protein [Betaproteobacteria bacterium]